MRNNHSIEQAFIEAVNNYIAVVNEDMIAYGLEESALWPFVSPIGEAYADDELVHRLQAYQFPDNTPHRHLFFLKEFKENHHYIAFGENSNYNSTYVIEKVTASSSLFPARLSVCRLDRISKPLEDDLHAPIALTALLRIVRA